MRKRECGRGDMTKRINLATADKKSKKDAN